MPLPIQLLWRTLVAMTAERAELLETILCALFLGFSPAMGLIVWFLSR
jgi:hypothetical protein